jgi:universal stress protein A
MTYQKLIVAVDNDHSNDQVCDRALAIAESCDAQLLLMHVVEPPTAPVVPGIAGGISVSSLPLDEDAHAKLIADNRTQLEAIAAKLGDRVVAQRVVESAIIRESVHQAAIDFGADLIVAGSHGRHGLSLFFTGSTTSDLLKNAPCDILAVRIAED